MSIKLRTPYQITLLEVGSPPADEPGSIKLYALDAGGGNIELFIRDADGNDSQITDGGVVTAGALLDASGIVDVSASAAPSTGQVLTATSATTATWQTPAGGGGTAVALATTGPAVTVNAATPPSTGQILTATSPTAADWQSLSVSIASQVTGLGTGIATFLSTPSSANLRTALTDETGSGSAVFATSPTLVTPNLGTPSAAVLTSATGLPISTGVAGLGSGVATFLATPSSANLAATLTDETGTGASVFAISPTLVTPVLGTPASGVMTNCTGRVNANQTADQIATSGSPVVVSSTAPSTGQVLTATSAAAANWQTPSGGGGAAEYLGTTGADVAVGTAIPPLAGQVLISTAPTTAVWGGLDAPATPHAEDEEFFGSSLPVGWDMYSYNSVNANISIPGPPVFGVGPNNGEVLGAVGQINSHLSLKAGLSPAAGQSFYFYNKPVASSVGTNCTWRARVIGHESSTTPQNGYARIQMYLTPQTSGLPHASHGISFGYVYDSNNLFIFFSGTDGGGSTATSVQVPAMTLHNLEFVIVKSGTTYTGLVRGGIFRQIGSMTKTLTIERVGFSMGANAGGTPSRPAVYVDYWRRQDTNNPFGY